MLKNKYFAESVALFLLLTLSYFLFQNAIASAVHIWTISEIFNHCFLVMPAALYLIYRKRFELFSVEIKPYYPAYAIILSILIVQVFAEIGDIKVLSHIALFTFIPFSIIAFLGLKASKLIAFPLAFMLLAVPFGEEFIPYLQSITADMSVSMLRAAGIPVFRSGLYIDIPAGKFLVAEACSGISFLISSIAFGSLYAYLSFETTRAKIGFLLLSIAIPIFANSVRVFGIISIAHVSEMKYAVGADHLIYGWFFYLVVLILLFTLGEKLSKNSNVVVSKSCEVTHSSWSTYRIPKASIPLLVMLTFGLVWQNQSIPTEDATQRFNFKPDFDYKTVETAYLGSTFVGPQELISISTVANNMTYQISIGVYPAHSHNEGISSLNEFFDKTQWSLSGNYPSISIGNSGKMPIHKLASSSGATAAAAQFYIVNDKVFSNSAKAKLYETYLKTLGLNKYTLMVIVSFPVEAARLDKSFDSMLLTQLTDYLLEEASR